MKAIVTLALSLLTTFAGAQILEPVKWQMTSQAVGDDEFDLIFTANIDDGWSIYSQHTDPSGPVPTAFYFDAGDHYSAEGEVAEKGDKKEGPDPLFAGVTVIKFTHGPVVFTQRVKVADYATPITGYLEFMTCDDERCLPPTEVDFNFKLEPAASNEKSGTVEEPAAVPAEPEAVGEELIASTDDQVEGEEAVAETTDSPAGTLTSASAKETKIEDGLLHPVLWQVDVTQLENQEYQVTFTAEMDEGWSLYSQYTEDNGPIPTTFITGEGESEKVIQFQEEGDLKEGMDPQFGVIVKKFDHGPIRFTTTVSGKDNWKGYIDYMSCDDSRCIPLNTPFEIRFSPLRVAVGEGPAAAPPSIAPSDPTTASLFPVDFNVVNEDPVGLCGEEVVVKERKSFWQIFILGFLGGLVALLTPCVFPMIPLTVSFFTKSAKSKKKGLADASMYGFFILLVYILLSIPFHLMDSINPDILNHISTNVWLNVSFFAIFLFFAFSFFGYYELTIPESWTNKASSAEGVGGIAGIFFMALTLALVSFSCTGPILGSLLAGALSADGGAMQLTMGMGGFGLALALPFALFAAFPGMMQSLPKSGGWLNNVKVVLGFLELGLALKFLSNADLVAHWDFLKIELFLGLWILIGIGLALYLFGKLKFPHDSPIKKLSPVRIGLGVVTVAFVAYLLSGFRINERSGSYESLTLLSGLAPPVCYSFWQPCDCPQGIECFKDLKEGMAYAREKDMPILLDFTGYACVNCRKMEEHVWPRREVLSYLMDDYVLISLYVDDKKELEETIDVTQKHNGRTRKLRTVGNKWSHFQAEYFNTNSQPFYVLLSPEGRQLTTPVGYTPDVQEYSEFLRCGLENYKRLTEMQESENTGSPLGMSE